MVTDEDAREARARMLDLVEDITDCVRAGDDLGDVLSAALGVVANRVGGIEDLVRARPGSWESEHIRRLAEPYAIHDVETSPRWHAPTAPTDAR